MPPSSTDEPVVDVSHIQKRFGGVTAVADLTLRVERGEIFGFLGPNGAGKTTSVKMLLGLTRPTAGTGTVLGKPLGNRPIRKNIGYLPELFRYHDWMSAREELAFHATLAGIPARERSHRIAAVLDFVGLAERGSDAVGTYSKGMQQRLGIAVALLGDPALVVLDEPTSALDPIGRRDVRELLQALRDRGTTVFLNSHLLSEVELICTRVAVIDRGRIIARGPIEEIVGNGTGVRLRVQPNGTPLEPVLLPFGSVRTSGEWTIVDGVAHDAIPQVVHALIEARADVYAVEPAIPTLEERFIALIRPE